MSLPSGVKKQTERQRARFRRMTEGGTPSLRGTLIKILVLALIDSGAFFVVMLLFPAKQYVYAGVLLVVIFVVNWIYLRRGGLPAKYLAPGVLFLLAFSVSVVFYSGYISFTNYGALHNGSKVDSIASIKLSAIVNDENAPFMDVTVMQDPSCADVKAKSCKLLFLASDANNAFLDDGSVNTDNEVIYLGGEDWATNPWHELTAEERAKVTFGMGLGGYDIATGYEGLTALSEDQLNSIQSRLSTMKVPLGASLEKDAFMALDPSGAGVQRTFFDAVYSEKKDSFTKTDGTVYKANESTGFFETKDGERLSETGWQVQVGFANYNKIFGDKELRGPLLKIFTWTIIFAFTSVVSTFIVGLALALLFNDERLRGKKVYRAIMILPYAFPAFLSAYVWKGMYNTENGFINVAILHAQSGKGIDWLNQEGPARWAVLLCNLWLGFPYMFLITTGALQAIPGELTESATIDGATPWQQFRLIKLPLLLVSLAPLLISSFAYNFNNFTIIYLITCGGPAGDSALKVDAGGTDILISFVYKIAFSTGVGADYGLASAFSVLIFFIVGGLSMLAFRRTKFLEEVA